MFPFERFMGVLKKYVHNRARPEGSISKGHQNEECIEFCINFNPDLKPIGVPESRHKGRLDGKGTLGGEQIICTDGHSLTEAHYTVLQNSALVAPYMDEHKNCYAPNTRSGLITRLHVNKPGVSPAGCRHVPCMTPLLKMTCTCCPSYHLRI